MEQGKVQGMGGAVQLDQLTLLPGEAVVIEII